MQNLSQHKPFKLAVQNNKNDLQNFDAVPELPTEAYTKIFLGECKMSFWRIFALCVPRQDYFRGCGTMLPENILQNYTQIYAILVLSGMTFKVIFV